MARKQRPLLSTLRDAGGGPAVILMGVLAAVLVSAARDVWPQMEAAAGHTR
ncbi:hypothetical protein ACIPSE_43905 [Streptomyces sp. NPDC090106]|uniref:hypothetical protein n=1 Tax=Streptomyces sp. NPDC090106 TaxID=3365946 RepID=UPI003801185E